MNSDWSVCQSITYGMDRMFPSPAVCMWGLQVVCSKRCLSLRKRPSSAMKVCKFPRYKALSLEENVHAMAMFQRRRKLDELFGGIMDVTSCQHTKYSRSESCFTPWTQIVQSRRRSTFQWVEANNHQGRSHRLAKVYRKKDAAPLYKL